VVLDLGDLARQTTALVGVQAAKRGVRVSTAIDVPLPVRGNPIHLKQVLLNLLLNAVQATNPGGEIHVRGGVRTGLIKGLEFRDVEGSLAEIVVEDEGPGIPEGDLAKVFSPSTRRSRRGRTGPGHQLAPHRGAWRNAQGRKPAGPWDAARALAAGGRGRDGRNDPWLRRSWSSTTTRACGGFSNTTLPRRATPSSPRLRREGPRAAGRRAHRPSHHGHQDAGHGRHGPAQARATGLARDPGHRHHRFRHDRDGCRAMKAGAFEYVTKPFNRDELILAVRKALRLRSLEHDNARLRREVEKKYGLENIIGDSPPLQRVFRLIEKVADSEAPVLITGESGTGKELVAKAIHFRSLRADQPFVAVNCAAIPRELLESELFGHRKGAFTGAVRDKKGRFEEAGGGTLLLDEIADLPVELQAKLLRALQEREFTPVGGSGVIPLRGRVIAATIATWRARSLRDGSARTCSIVSRWFRSTCRACGSVRGHPAARRALPANPRRRQEGHGEPGSDGCPQTLPLEGQRARA